MVGIGGIRSRARFELGFELVLVLALLPACGDDGRAMESITTLSGGTVDTGASDRAEASSTSFSATSSNSSTRSVASLRAWL